MSNSRKVHFQPLTTQLRDELFNAKLTASEWRFWVYLVTLDPYGDTGKDYNPEEIILNCGMSKSSYFAAKAKFQRLQWFDFKDGNTRARNLRGFLSVPGVEVQNPGVEVQNPGVEVQNPGVEVQNPGVEVQNPGVEVQNPGVEVQNPGVAHYKDHAHDQITDQSDSIHNSQIVQRANLRDESEEEPAKFVEVEIVPSETSLIDPRALNLAFASKGQTTHEDQCSAPSQHSKFQELLNRFDRGEISHIPDFELKQIAPQVIGDVVRCYRRSGWILNSSSSDIDPQFTAYILQRDRQSEHSYANRLIRKIEGDPTRWGELRALVCEWQTGSSAVVKQVTQQLEVQQRAAHTLEILEGV